MPARKWSKAKARKSSGAKRRVWRKKRSAYGTDTKRWKLPCNQIQVYSPAGSGVISTDFSYGALSLGSIGSGNAGSSYKEFVGSMCFRLDQAIMTPQLKNLYDRYKISGARIKVIPQNNMSAVNQGGLLPTMKVVHDYDDAGTGQTVAGCYSRVGKIYRLDKPFSFFVKPKMLRQVFGGVQNGNTVWANQPTNAAFLDMTNVQVPHFAVKFAVRDFYCSTTATNAFRIEVTLYVTTKNQIYNTASDLIENSGPREGENEVNDDIDVRPEAE